MSYIHDIVKSMGKHSESVTLKKVSKSNVNKWGDATSESVEEEDVTAVVEVMSGESEEVVEGKFETGDIKLFVDNNQSGVSDGNIFVYQGKDYRVEEVLDIEIGHDGHYEVLASRV